MNQKDEKKPHLDTLSLENWLKKAFSDQPIRQADIGDLGANVRRSALKIGKKDEIIDPGNLVPFKAATHEKGKS